MPAPDPHPWTALHARCHHTLRQRQLLLPDQRLLVAVSGGQDSLCLIKLLLDLQPKWGWHLAIAHCNHRWRPDSQANAEHVAILAQHWQLPLYSVTAQDIPPTEAQARQWRYQELQAIAAAAGFPNILTGHTASDRAETLLHNLLRGSGADGLQALVWQRYLTPEIRLIRPLLEVTRAETLDFCRQFALPIWEDATNQDLNYRRNRIRQELIPYLQSHFNPRVELALAQTAEILHTEVEYLEAMASDWLERATAVPESLLASLGESDRPMGLNRQVLRQLAPALQRRVIRQFLQRFLGIAANFEQIEKATTLISAANRCRSDPLRQGWVLEVAGDWIWLKELP